MKTHSMIFVALLLLVSTSSARENESLKKCENAISTKFSKWQRASVTNEVAIWSNSTGGNPTQIYGDFNGDGYQDTALLIQVGSNPRNDYPARLDSLYIAICLNEPPAAILHLINKPYCGDSIALSRKGTTYYDFVTEKTGQYPFDGVAAICFEKASATYIYNGKKFIQIVDGD